MSSKFENPAWHNAVARIIGTDNAHGTADALVHALGQVVSHEGTCLLAFRRDSAPQVLHHSLEPAGQKHYLDRYLAGPYLLDPLYQLAMQRKKPSLCRFRDQLPDRFRSSEYYRQYCEQTHLRDEMDYLASVDESTTLALVVGRRKRMFNKAELERLQLVEPTVQAAVKRIWELSSGSKAVPADAETMHAKLIACFEHFGDGVLTSREQQISQLLLRGHSTKSIARVLRIAPGTVMVHKRNLFAKLDISSQYELFSLFIDQLGVR